MADLDPLTESVVAFRLNSMESEIKSMDRKLDNMIESYPSAKMLELTLMPLNTKIHDLEQENKSIKRDIIEKEKDKALKDQQFKVAVAAAIGSPIVSTILAMIVTKNGV